MVSIGIYKIENIINHKVYIGQSVNVDERLKTHKYHLQRNAHINEHLQNAWNKYGNSNFTFSIIEKCDENKLTEREQYWIDYYGGMNSDNTYNYRDAGSCGKLSEEHKRKIGLGNKGKIHSDEWKQKHNNAIRGKPAWNKGLTSSDKRVQKYIRKKGEFRHSEETKKMLSEKLKGRKFVYKDLEQRKLNMSVAQKNRKHSDEENDRLRKIAIGRIWINNEVTSKMIYPSELQYYLSNGFKKGRIGWKNGNSKNTCSKIQTANI